MKVSLQVGRFQFCRGMTVLFSECEMLPPAEDCVVGWPQSANEIIDCTCCGKGLLEIKCPYKHCSSTILSAPEDSQFCLKSVDGEVSLKRTHSYFYQVQTQLYVCKADICDFCVCLFHPDREDDFLVEGVFPDSALWDVCVERLNFFRDVLLPELVGKWYTSTSYRLR